MPRQVSVAMGKSPLVATSGDQQLAVDSKDGKLRLQ